MQIDIPAQSSRIPPLFRQAFRPFFLLGPIFGVIALWLWVGSFLAPGSFAPYGGGLWWHAHEMLFGFTGAIIAGFLLTAVQNWTNTQGVRGWPLALLTLLWLLARFFEALPVLPDTVIATIDLLFFPAVAFVLGQPIVRARQWRNLVFVPILIFLTVANLMTYVAVWTGNAGWFQHGAHGAILLIILLITVVGGRVIPFFTARGTNTENIAPLPVIERTAFTATALMAAIALSGTWQVWNGLPAALIALLAAAAHIARQSRWRTLSTRHEPLLWSLHGAYAFIAPGFLLAAAYSLRLLPTPSPMVHVFTVGVLSALMLAMVARVSLGHSGRPLQIAPAMKFAFAAVLLAALTRTLPPLLGYWNHWLVYVGSALLWSIGFGLFIWHYALIFIRPRADGRMG